MHRVDPIGMNAKEEREGENKSIRLRGGAKEKNKLLINHVKTKKQLEEIPTQTY